MKNLYHLPCNIAQALNIIGDKWTLLIIRQLMLGHNTFKEIQTQLEGIPTNLLSDRIKCLEEDGLIHSVLYQQHPPRFRYTLTESGDDLSDIFNLLLLWGEKNLPGCDKQLVHQSCGHPIELQYYCGHCGKAIYRDYLTLEDKKISPDSDKFMNSQNTLR